MTPEQADYLIKLIEALLRQVESIRDDLNELKNR